MALTSTLYFCGFLWHLASNPVYQCETTFSRKECSVTLTCYTGENVLDLKKNLLTKINNTLTLNCQKTPTLSTDTLTYYDKLGEHRFMGAISCQKYPPAPLKEIYE